MTDNPVVLITGGLTGIGHAAAIAFAKERRTRRRLGPPGPLRAWPSPPNCAAWAPRRNSSSADVRVEDDVRNLVDQTVARFGRLDIAVNNAGTEGKRGP